jgi:hypothetical protein
MWSLGVDDSALKNHYIDHKKKTKCGNINAYELIAVVRSLETRTYNANAEPLFFPPLSRQEGSALILYTMVEIPVAAAFLRTSRP